MNGAAGEGRKVVTVLFADITGSTSLGERLDPESLRGLLTRYFEEMRTIVERHGGLVSKFIGDAVMAVFGIPTRHEDDALRAVRAAWEMRGRLAQLNDEFAADWGVTVAVRTGLNTGDVLTAEPSDADSLVVGDVVNVAARLEQEAQPGEILVGEETYRLVADAVEAERAGPLELRGRDAAVGAWRLLDVSSDAPGWARRLDSVLVGREDELRRMKEAFARIAERESCELVTVMGPAGVGKSRLTAELIAQVGTDATVLHGRCLSYGEGITFWPIASVVMGAIGMQERDSRAEAARRIAELLAATGADAAENQLVSNALTSLLGTPDIGIQETSWAVRKFLERLAAGRPLVVVFDDIHWGEPTFLDLVDYLSDWISGAPVLILCQARPELLEVRPGWTTAKPNASLITLAPLTEEQTDGLIRGLVGGTGLPADARTRITELTEGNPLFVEETIRMLIDDGALRQAGGQWIVTRDLSSIAIPPTILALLSARLDRLDADQRPVIERAAVGGRSFWWGAVSALSPEEVRPRVGAALQSLVRKELIRPDSSELRGEDAFRFTHILVRDATYNGIPKARRAGLHERMANWIEVKTRDLAGEYEEIAAYHLEQAHTALLELGPPNTRTTALAERAAQRLGAAGARASARGDIPAAVSLLTRAVGLLPDRHPQRLELLPDFAFALLEAADFERLGAVASELAAAAAAGEDTRLQAHSAIIDLWIRFFTNPQAWPAEAEREAQRTIETFERLGDERGVARGWSLLGLVGILSSQFAPAVEAWTRVVEHAQRAGNRREALDGLTWVAAALWLGPTPATEGIPRCRELFQQAHGDRKAMATALFAEGGLEAALGHFEEAHALFARSRALLEQIGLPVWDAGALTQAIGWGHLLAGRPELAEQELRRGYDRLHAIGEASFLSTVAGFLAEALYAQGRVEEALDFTRTSEEAAGGEDIYSQVLWRSVRAKCLVRQSETAGAVELAGEAVELVGTTDSLDLVWLALMSQAEVLRLAERVPEAETVLNEAIRIAERKQNVAAAKIAREALAGDDAS
jgi:class 3 adenylate cyclase/tetratricopeptide (TPR) repeat protein